MKIHLSFSLRACVSAAIALSAGNAIPAPLTAAQAQAAQGDVIVIMRDQMDNVPPARRALASRALALSNSQSAVVAHLQRLQARTVRSFATINAFATKATPAEVAELSDASQHPEVLSVVPDRVIHALPRREKTAATAAATAGVVSGSVTDLCGNLEPEALQVTNTAFGSTATAQAQTVIDGHGQPVTGKGVKVAFLADALDPNITGFIRPDGSRVFVDYQDFTGDPVGSPTGGAEAYGDASSIAAQDMPKGKPLLFDISQFVSPTHPLPTPCNIRIRGMAPGASLVGLAVFSGAGVTTTSNFVQALDYAVKADVDVINESFGGNPYPDNENDPISLANTAAIKAGITVTVSTGDAGIENTLGSPSTSSDVIAVGATTTLRSDAQTGQGILSLLPKRGYVSNNIAALSSGGFAQLKPRTVDVVAPGESGWALCTTNVAVYTECTSDGGNPSPIQDFGGTSQSSPLTAGEAALVIQAYRSTHGGSDPSPATVKRIIMSSATDLGAPSSEQGAGLINSLGAVYLALSINDGNGKPKPHGLSLVSDLNSIVITAEADTHETESFKITNPSAVPRTVTPTMQTLGAQVAGGTTYVHLNPASDPSFPNVTGALRSYVKQTFTLPAKADLLDVSIAFPTNVFTATDLPFVYLGVVDPAGREVQYSLPQGAGSGYAIVDVVKPMAGTYTAYVWTRTSGTGSYTGPVELVWSAKNFVAMGKVSPSTATIAPGATQAFTASFFTPSNAGDLSAGIRFADTATSSTMAAIPVSLRTLVPIGPRGGSFSGTLTGGNGRGDGNTQTYEFDVPPGVKDMSVSVPIADSAYALQGFLIDPQGMQLSVGANVDATGAPQYGLQHFHYSPQPGRWKFLLAQAVYSSGNQVALPYTGRIAFNQAQIFAPTLPNSADVKLSASGKPVTVKVDVTNTGLSGAAYFVDARTASSGVTNLPVQTGCAMTSTLPGTCSNYIVPTQVSKVLFTAKSSVPIQMDAYNLTGFILQTDNPDLFASKTGTNAVAASLIEPEIPYGLWQVSPSEIGPYKAAGGAPTEPVTVTGSVVMKGFDSAVSSDSGDFWADAVLGTNTFNPLLIPAGESGVISVTITPDPSLVGKVVNGYVIVDTYNPSVGTGDEVYVLPYRYTVAP
jgi:hypothetical protein